MSTAMVNRDVPQPRSGRTLQKPQLRIATAGSVDDGKSTLIGRLLHDTKTIFEDQLDAVRKASRRYGDQEINLALLTDGLRAEREQGITIDVAYRYFATPKRSFVLADTPGHAQYTRNMVTGASVSDVALVLVDARHGVVEQTRRHLAIAALLGVNTVVLTVNKMDLIGWDPATFCAIVDEVQSMLQEISATVAFHAIPVSALNGDNIVDRSAQTPWYSGPTMLDLLENLEIDESDVAVGARLAVQWTIRSGADYRGYAGTLAGGPLKLGDEITVLPAGHRSTIRALTIAGVGADRAYPGDAIAVELNSHVDIGRGDVLVVTNATRPPQITGALVVDVCWMSETPVTAGQRVLIKHLTRHVGARVTSVVHRLSPETLRREGAEKLALNDLGRLELQLDAPIVADPYARSRSTGHLIIIDEATNTTAGAATIADHPHLPDQS